MKPLGFRQAQSWLPGVSKETHNKNNTSNKNKFQYVHSTFSELIYGTT